MGRRARGTAVAAVGLAAVVLVAVVSTRDQHGPVPASTAGTPAAHADHAEEIARDQQVADASMPASPGALWSASAFATGTDTPAGWQVQGRRDVVQGRDVAAGNRQVQLTCAGRGSLTVEVTVSTADGAELDRQTFPTECSAQGAGAAASFTVPAGDSQYSVDIAPADGAIAAVAYRVT